MDNPAPPPPRQLRRWRLAFWLSGGMTPAFPVLGYLATQAVAWWLAHQQSLGKHQGGLADIRTILMPAWIGILLGGASLLVFLGAGLRLLFLKRSALEATM